MAREREWVWCVCGVSGTCGICCGVMWVFLFGMFVVCVCECVVCVFVVCGCLCLACLLCVSVGCVCGLGYMCVEVYKDTLICLSSIRPRRPSFWLTL